MQTTDTDYEVRQVEAICNGCNGKGTANIDIPYGSSHDQPDCGDCAGYGSVVVPVECVTGGWWIPTEAGLKAMKEMNR